MEFNKIMDNTEYNVDPEFHLNEGNTYLKDKNFIKAIKEYDKGLLSIKNGYYNDK